MSTVPLGRSLVLLAAALAVPSGTFGQTRQSSLQVTEGLRERILVSKDVGDDRWAITYDRTDDTVSGNVYPQAGGAPTFFDCSARNPREYRSDLELSCRSSSPGCGATPPTTTTCPGSDEWREAGVVQLPRSFFGLRSCGDNGDGCASGGGGDDGQCCSNDCQREPFGNRFSCVAEECKTIGTNCGREAPGECCTGYCVPVPNSDPTTYQCKGRPEGAPCNKGPQCDIGLDCRNVSRAIFQCLP
jgi:hypothetical protein